MKLVWSLADKIIFFQADGPSFETQMTKVQTTTGESSTSAGNREESKITPNSLRGLFFPNAQFRIIFHKIKTLLMVLKSELM